MSFDFRHYNNIKGFSVFSNNHIKKLEVYHPPQCESLLHESRLIYDSASDIVRIDSVSIPRWNRKSKRVMEQLELKMSRHDCIGTVTEVSANRLNIGIVGPYVLDSYHVKVDMFQGNRAYLERLGWMKLGKIKCDSDEELDFSGYTTGLVKVSVDSKLVEKLYYFNLEKALNNLDRSTDTSLNLINIDEDDVYPVDEFFTTDWYWVPK